MSSPRLRAQFEKLFESFGGKDSDIQLEEVTEILFCTRRNARIVLNKLAEEGWIEWHPAAGRGNQSKLIFKRNRQDVSENLAKRYLEEGKIGQALNVLDRDAGKLTQVIQGYLGIQHHEGSQVIRLPYYRPLSMLNPTKPHRRSELHIIRQIFSGLTKLDDNDEIKPDLAHTWEAISEAHWRFYLRSGVRFHNGTLLQTEHVIESLLNASCSPCLNHIHSVSSPAPLTVDIKLTSPDWHLPLTLTEAVTKILLPESTRGEDFDLMPIGTGPYHVQVNDEKRLILEAFDGYFGYRPLIDKVEVWVIDEVFSSMVYPSLSNPIKPEKTTNDEIELDPGCTYLLLNKKHGLMAQPEWSNYIATRLNALSLFKALPDQIITEMGLLPAMGLKPGWQHIPLGFSNCEPPEKRKVTVAYHSQHPIFPHIAKTIEGLLLQDGVGVNFVKYEYKLEKPESVDIWLKPMGIGTNRDDALIGWLLGYSDIQAMSNSEDFDSWFSMVETWRKETTMPFPAKQLGKSLVEKHQIVPMFHCWLGVSKDHCGTLQNAKCNALGWFDFSTVWVRPEQIEE